MKKSIVVMLCFLCALTPALSSAAGQSIDDLAQQILGAQQVDDVLASFATPAPEGMAEKPPEITAGQAPTELPPLPEDAVITYKFSIQPVFPANQISRSG